MKLFQDLKRVISHLEKFPGCWGICGGIAAAIYRDTPRFTGDIDFMISHFGEYSAEEIAHGVIQSMGFKPIAGWVTDEKGKVIESQALVIGRVDNNEKYVGIDFLLPVLPWIQEAVERAQLNLLDYGFARIPTITVEDIFISKLFAYQGTPTRHNDLDDVQSILRTSPDLDRQYLLDRLKKYQIVIPDSVAIK